MQVLPKQFIKLLCIGHRKRVQKMVQLIVVDLDGTLLSERDEVHPENIRAIERCRKRGIKVCPVTARNWNEIQPILQQVTFDGIAAINNGACIVSLDTGERLYESYFDTENVSKIVSSITNQPFVFLSLLGYDYMHLVEGTGTVSWLHHYDKETQRKMGIQLYQDVEALLKNSQNVQRVTCSFLKQQGGQIRPLLNQIQRQCRCKAMFMQEAGGDYVEISPEKVGKASAMQRISQYFGIELEHVMAFGDNENDIEMLKTAGFSVAMGNADKEVKQVATMVTSNNWEGGVATALQTLIS